MEKNVFQKHAKMMGTIWKKAKKQADSGTLGDIFEDGRYKMGLMDTQATESQKGDFMVVLSLNFLEGEYIGKTKKIFRVITPENAEKGLARIILDINKLGYEIEEFEQIESALEEIREARPVIRVTLKTRGDYQDGYLDKMLTGEEAENTEDESAGSEEVPEPEEITLEIGMKVKFDWKGEELEGEVKEILEDEEKVKVKVGNKIYPVKADKISLVEEEPAEEESEEVPEEPEEEPEEEVKPVKKILKKIGAVLKKKKR